MTCIVTVTAQLWFKVSEGLTSHLETFILFCISKYEGVCGRGPGVICATALVVFQCLWDYAGYDQRYPCLSACMRTAFPFKALAFAVSLRLWVWVFIMYVSQEKLKNTFLYCIKKKKRTLWRVLDPFHNHWINNSKLAHPYFKGFFSPHSDLMI